MIPQRRESREGGGGKMIRTTLELPEELWRAVKVRALDDGSLRAVILNALEKYLKKPTK